MAKIQLVTPDISQENIEKLTGLFPQVATEIEDENGVVKPAVDFDALRDLLGDVAEGQRERYQFTWPGKAEAKLEARKSCDKTLRPHPEKSVDWGTTQNVYIEGNNLNALKVMRETYAGKVKLIYIDPPYNTGHDFIYDDDFAQTHEEYDAQSGEYDEEGGRLVANPEGSGRFHSDWCSMMYPRLLLARDLLSSDGSIFISIDDNELNNLVRICEEIFGTQNFIGIVTVVVKPEGRRYGLLAKTHEYLVCFTKDITQTSFNEISAPGASFSYQDEKGGFNLQSLRNRNVRAFNSTNRPNLRYPFWVDVQHPDANNMYKVSVDEVSGWEKIWASTVDSQQSVWRWGKEKARTQADELVAYRGSDGDIRVFQIVRKLTQTAKTLWDKKGFQSNLGTKEVANLLGKGVFDFPKPLGLLSEIVQIATDSKSLVLDFFSGSATMAEAVMLKNAEDGGSRRFVLVQLPENCETNSRAYQLDYQNICDIGEERIRRSGKKIAEEIEASNKQLKLGEDPKPVPDIGFRVFSIDSSNFLDTYIEPGEQT